MLLGLVVAAFITALLALGLAAWVVVKVYLNAAAFYGSAARFADAIENRAIRLVRGPAPSPDAEPAPRMGPPMPDMPEILKTRWRERTHGSNIPDAWQMPAEEV